MENDVQVKYDSLCYATFLNIKCKTEGAKRIVFRNFNGKDEEHLFVLSIACACIGLLGERDIAVDGDSLTRARLSRTYKALGGIRVAKKGEKICVDVPEMLEFMRPHAQELCGEEFSFADIYNEYYSGKGDR